jgi:AraC-like DNA-binding protein
MVVSIDTTAVPPAERFEYWSDASCDAYHPLELQQEFARPFWGRAVGHALGPLTVFRVAADASSITRTPRTIAASDPERLQLLVQVRGRSEVAQDGRRAVLGPGELASCDSSRPYRVHALTPFELVAVIVPKVLLRPHLERTCARTAARIEHGAGRLAASFFREIADGLEEGRLGELDGSVAESVLDLVLGLYADDPVAPAPRATRTDLLLRIHAFIDANLGDPALSAETIARGTAVSVRYLHKLFATQGVTLGEWIRAKRLDRCRRDLADPALAGETILLVATRWGLPNAAHFSRLFRETYGCSPREFRSWLHSGAARYDRTG